MNALPSAPHKEYLVIKSSNHVHREFNSMPVCQLCKLFLHACLLTPHSVCNSMVDAVNSFPYFEDKIERSSCSSGKFAHLSAIKPN